MMKIVAIFFGGIIFGGAVFFLIDCLVDWLFDVKIIIKAEEE